MKRTTNTIGVAMPVLCIMSFASMAFCQKPVDNEQVRWAMPKIRVIAERINRFLEEERIAELRVGEVVLAFRSEFDEHRQPTGFFEISLNNETKPSGSPPKTEEPGVPLLWVFKLREDQPNRIFWRLGTALEEPAEPESIASRLKPRFLAGRFARMVEAAGAGGECRVSRVVPYGGTAHLDYRVRVGAFWEPAFGLIGRIDTLYGVPVDEVPSYLEAPAALQIQAKVSEKQAVQLMATALSTALPEQYRRGCRLLPCSDMPLPKGAEGKTVSTDAYGETVVFSDHGRPVLLSNRDRQSERHNPTWLGTWTVIPADDARDLAVTDTIAVAVLEIDALTGEVVSSLISPSGSDGFGDSETRRGPFRWSSLGQLVSVVVDGKVLYAKGVQLGAIQSPVTGRRVPVMLVFQKAMLPAKYDALSGTFIVEANGKEHFATVPKALADRFRHH